MGKKYTANAKSEIVISAGVYGTTKLLLLSGIGPQSHLKEKKYPCSERSSSWNKLC